MCKIQKEELHRAAKDMRRQKKQLRTYEVVMKLRQTPDKPNPATVRPPYTQERRKSPLQGLQ
jgi:hypothetical protein